MTRLRKRPLRDRGSTVQKRGQAREEDGGSELELSSDHFEDSGSDEQWEMPRPKKGRPVSTFSPSPKKNHTAGSRNSNCSTPVSTRKNSNSSSPVSARKKSKCSSPISARKRGRARKTLAMDECDKEDGVHWHNIEEEDVEPPQMKFRPARDVGPQLNRTSKYTPLELFQLYFSTEVINLLVRNTNAYGKCNDANWVTVRPKDMYSYIALVLYMGLVPLKTLLDYWKGTRLYCLPFPVRTMACSRFNIISRNLHMNEPDVEAANEKKKGTQEYDKLCKVRPLYEHILQACQTYYHPKQHLSIDERMVASKARIGFKQYVKNKPTKWGFKLFVLADMTGYTLNFFVYDGKVGEPSGNGQSYDVVMRLLKSTTLGTGYKLYVDNYYTSPTLFRHLLQRKIAACGTIRSTLRDYPKVTRNKMPSKAPRGTIRWLRQKELLFIKWYDAREVSLCSTIHKASTTEFVKRKVKNAKGRWTEQQVPIPDCIKDYNQYMGGVDLSDALINSYNVIHKTQKWYKTLFFHFVDIAAVNAFILHKQLCAMQHKQMLTQKAFREALVVELADIGSIPVRTSLTTLLPPTPVKLPPPKSSNAIPESPSTNKQSTSNDTSLVSQDFGLLQYGHLPAAFSEQLKGVPSRFRGTKGRRTCIVCGQKTQVYCSVCLKTMCFNSSRNCYRVWHRRNLIAS